MAFKMEGIMAIQGATLELSAKQLAELGDAAKPFRVVCEVYRERFMDPDSVDPGTRPEELQALDVVGEFLDSCESMVNQAGVVRPKRRMPKRKKAS